MKFFGLVWHYPGTSRLDFCGNLDMIWIKGSCMWITIVIQEFL